MDVKVEDVSSVKKKLSFEVPSAQVDAEIKKAYEKIGKSAKVKGFRAGKVPQAILEQYYGPQMEEQVLGRLINDSYFRALKEHQIPAVSDPEIVGNSPLAKGQPFTYEAHVEIKPEVSAQEYTGLSLKKEKFAPNPGIVDERLEEMRANRAQLEVSKRKIAAKGDFTVIDFKGFKDGEPFAGGEGQDHLLELGSGSFIPGFEDQVEGMKRGETRNIEVSFPENYGNKDLAGQPALFEVTLKEIKEKVMPALDDEFARSFGLENLQDLKEKLEENYVTQEKNRIEGDLRERLIDALIVRNPIEVPEAMVQGQLDHMLKNVRDRFQSQGMTLEMLGMNDESFRQMYHETAKKQVQGSLLLEAVGRQEEIGVEEGEIDGKLTKIAEMAQAPLEDVKTFYQGDQQRQGLVAQIQEEKVIDFLLGKAKIKEVEKAKLEGEKKEEKNK